MNNKFKISLFSLVIGVASFQAQEKIGIQTQNMDTKVRPNDDFYRYVNGAWMDKTEIPADRSRWGSFNELRKASDDDIKAILNDAIKNKSFAANSDQARAINLYLSVLDTVTRNKVGIKPILPAMAKIDKIKTSKDIFALMLAEKDNFNFGFFGSFVNADAKNSNKNVMYLATGALGLPDREYYVSDAPDSKEKREKYVAHVARVFSFIGMNSADALNNAKKVLDFETALVTPQFDRVELRDDTKTYNPRTIAELQKMFPLVNWKNYYTTLGIKNIDNVIVSEPKYMEALAQLLAKNEVDSWKAYMKWTVLNGNAGFLSTSLEKANWEFYSKELNGAKKQLPAVERAITTVNGFLGEALGKLYVDKKFPAVAKTKAQEMIANLFKAYEKRINNLPWMSKATKENALLKLKKYRVKIGYPDKWKNFSEITVKSPENGGNFYENVANIAKWMQKDNYAKLTKPVDKDEWFMSPQTVNAYYNPAYNEIVFPAAILQPPFFDYRADEAVNYGGIGAVIGHEISHGFDDSGARYNADGNLVDWWSAEDLKQFTSLGTSLADQYSALQPLPGIFVDGKFTLGENIGDLGGVNAAYDGLQIFLKEKGRPANIDGFSPEQRFFLSYGTIWRTKSRDEAIKVQVKTDPHSPAMYRAYVPLQNIQAFYDAFNIKQGDKMYLADDKRVKIW